MSQTANNTILRDVHKLVRQGSTGIKQEDISPEEFTNALNQANNYYKCEQTEMTRPCSNSKERHSQKILK